MPLQHLNAPIKIGTVTVRNRIVFPPIDVALHRVDRIVDQRYIDFLVRLAENNGVGLIISEFTAVANDQFWAPASRIDKDEFIQGFVELVEQVHAHGAKIFMQLALLGGRAPKGRAVAPSALASPLYPGVPEELSREEIRLFVRKWCEAAVRAKKIGFDGVEVHGGHSYLVGAFMSPHANQREDEYGYDFDGRMRFPTEIIRGIKEVCGEAYPVGVKFSAYEALENGITGPLSVDIARRIEKVGADYLHVSSSTYMLAGTRYPDVPPLYVPEGPLTPFTEKIKKHAGVPVIAVAGIASPERAEEIISRGMADMVAVGRAMFADLQWASKVGCGREGQITPCIRCNVCHKKIVIDRAGEVECTVNPGLLGRSVAVASKKKRVVVIGGGPAGLEAAITASERGHDVVLYEKAHALGGNIRLGCIPPFKKDLARLLDFYELRLKASGVSIKNGNELSDGELGEMSADAVIVAVGAEENIPSIPGIDRECVVKVRDFYRDSKAHKRRKGHSVVFGAGEVGCELAWYLSLLDRTVYLIDILPYDRWLHGVHPTNRFILLEQIAENRVQVLDEARHIEIEPRNKVISLVRGCMTYRISADEIILATGYRKSDRLFQNLRKRLGREIVYAAGDCADPRDIHWAIREGYEAGLRV